MIDVLRVLLLAGQRLQLAPAGNNAGRGILLSVLFERIDYYTISNTCLHCGDPVECARVMTRVAGERPLVATLCTDCAVMEVERAAAKNGVRPTN